MANFDPAIKVILAHEGGWVDNPADPGGETNYGISMLIIQREGITPAELGIDSFHPGCLKQMSVDTAKKLYQRLFWDKYAYGSINSQLAATKIFDASVNCGPSRGHKFAQRAATKLGVPLTDDGVLGPKTMAAINSLDPQAFVNAYCDEQLAYYQAIVKSNPKLSVFLNNWTRRSGWGRG